jgi:hypothetical protein
MFVGLDEALLLGRFQALLSKIRLGKKWEPLRVPLLGRFLAQKDNLDGLSCQEQPL